MELVSSWRSLIEILVRQGLSHRTSLVSPNAKAYSSHVAGEPLAKDLEPFLPASYREFVSTVGYPAFDLGERHRICFLPPVAMLQVTGAMGDGARPFDETRELRKAKKYDWPFAFFAGWDFSDVNGWCFMPPEASNGKKTAGREAIVWSVEDSLPESPLTTFEKWFARELAAAAKAVDSPAKVKKLLAYFESEEDDRKKIGIKDF